jgi:hypothetical protein
MLYNPFPFPQRHSSPENRARHRERLLLRRRAVRRRRTWPAGHVPIPGEILESWVRERPGRLAVPIRTAGEAMPGKSMDTLCAVLCYCT